MFKGNKQIMHRMKKTNNILREIKKDIALRQPISDADYIVWEEEKQYSHPKCSSAM